MHWRADTRHWHATIEKILTNEPASANDQAMKLQRFQLALFERDFIDASRAVAALPQEPVGDGFSRDFWMGVVARAKGRRGCCPSRLYGRACRAGSSGPRSSTRQPDVCVRALQLGDHRRWTGAKRRSVARRPAGSRTRAHRKRLDGRSAGCIPTWHGSTRGLANATWPSSNSK